MTNVATASGEEQRAHWPLPGMFSKSQLGHCMGKPIANSEF
jgi:hypothetical protein